MSRIFITTAIPYVNASPHIGHALELVQVDTLARAWRAEGHDVRALTGTDDNAIKNVDAAAAAGVPVADLVRTNGDRFVALGEPLELAFDDVIRTAFDPRHRRGVERLWRACAAAGDLEQRDYDGLYCLGCEAFLDDDDLDASGRCREHGAQPERVTERNWFFRLSRHRDRIAAAIRTGELRIEPVARRNEVLAVLDRGIDDISVSRPASRARGWGIPVPGDPSQVVYVWFDALASYLTSLTGGDDEAHWWQQSDERIHVVGKGILRFHAITWPAILASAGLALPTAVLVHDYLTVDGAKISKSAGNGAAPDELVASFGTDAVRWWLLRESPLGSDTDFTADRLVRRANEDLANGFGNLVARTVTLRHRIGAPAAIAAGEPKALAAQPVDAEIADALDHFDFRRATRRICELVDDANAALERVRPWELAREDPRDPRIAAVLGDVTERCRRLALLLAPFVPAVSRQALRRLDATSPNTPSGPVFARLTA